MMFRLPWETRPLFTHAADDVVCVLTFTLLFGWILTLLPRGWISHASCHPEFLLHANLSPRWFFMRQRSPEPPASKKYFYFISFINDEATRRRCETWLYIYISWKCVKNKKNETISRPISVISNKQASLI